MFDIKGAFVGDLGAGYCAFVILFGFKIMIDYRSNKIGKMFGEEDRVEHL